LKKTLRGTFEVALRTFEVTLRTFEVTLRRTFEMTLKET